MRSESNEEVVRRWQNAYNSGDIDALDALLAPEWATNNWLEGVPKSVNEAKAVHRLITQVFPDLHYETLELMSDGDRVVQRYVGQGTHKSDFLGLTATGRVITWGGMNLFRTEGGRIVEHWGYADDVGVLHQMGAALPEAWLLLRHH